MYQKWDITFWHIVGHPNVPKWHKIRWSVMPKRNRIDTFDDGLLSRSMTTTAAKGANNPKKMSQFGAGFTLFPDDIGVVFTRFPDVAPSQITHFPTDERLRPPPPITLFQRFCQVFYTFFLTKNPFRRGFSKVIYSRSPIATSVSQVSHLSGTQSR